MLTQKIRVKDMQCTGCAARARTVLMRIRGVVKVITSLDDHMAEVTFDERAAQPGDLLAALQAAGFTKPNGKCC